jgi:hypothetical protein
VSGVYEYANSDWDFLGVNEIVENYWSSVVAIFSDEGVSILEYHQSGRFRCIVLRRNIHVVATNRFREYLAVFPDVVSKGSLGGALVAKGILAQRIVRFNLRFLGPNERDGECKDENSEDRAFFHCD